MATLQFENGTCVTDFESIVSALEPLGLELARAPIDEEPQLAELLARPSLSDEDKQGVLNHLSERIEALAGSECEGYDLVVLHDDVPKLDELLSTFAQCHTHPDDEVRYIVDGQGVFGFVMPDKSQVELTVIAPEYISVPKDIEHWFHLTEARRIKAVRIFMKGERWEANFTGTETRFD